MLTVMKLEYQGDYYKAIVEGDLARVQEMVRAHGVNELICVCEWIYNLWSIVAVVQVV